jgi:hypothetical protein
MPARGTRHDLSRTPRRVLVARIMYGILVHARVTARAAHPLNVEHVSQCPVLPRVS